MNALPALAAFTALSTLQRVRQLEGLILRHHGDAAAQRDIAALTRRLLDEGLIGPGELMRMHAEAAALAAAQS